MSPYGTPKKEYTIFCRQSNGKGTMYISTVHASDHEIAGDTSDIEEEAIASCAEAWGWEGREDEIELIGIARGDVDLISWDDGE